MVPRRPGVAARAGAGGRGAGWRLPGRPLRPAAAGGGSQRHQPGAGGHGAGPAAAVLQVRRGRRPLALLCCPPAPVRCSSVPSPEPKKSQVLLRPGSKGMPCAQTSTRATCLATPAPRRLPQNNAALSIFDFAPAPGGSGPPTVDLVCLNQVGPCRALTRDERGVEQDTRGPYNEDIQESMYAQFAIDRAWASPREVASAC